MELLSPHPGPLPRGEGVTRRPMIDFGGDQSYEPTTRFTDDQDMHGHIEDSADVKTDVHIAAEEMAKACHCPNMMILGAMR